MNGLASEARGGITHGNAPGEVFNNRNVYIKRAIAVQAAPPRRWLASMKIRLVLSTKSPKQGKPIELKLNVPPAKQIGFINFVNAAMQGDSAINISFEKIAKESREKSKIQGEFKFFQGESSKPNEKK